MNDIYSELQNVTKEIMGEFKQGEVRLVKITKGGGPAHNPGPSTKQYYSLNATAKGVSFKYVAQGLAIESDIEVTSSVRNDVEPSDTDIIELDGIEYKIVKDVSVPAIGTKIAWKFIVRKGG